MTEFNIAWPEFIIQVITVLVPVGIVYAKQSARIAALEVENVNLRAKFETLQERYDLLSKRYEATLKERAGIRGRF